MQAASGYQYPRACLSFAIIVRLIFDQIYTLDNVSDFPSEVEGRSLPRAPPQAASKGRAQSRFAEAHSKQFSASLELIPRLPPYRGSLS